MCKLIHTTCIYRVIFPLSNKETILPCFKFAQTRLYYVQVWLKENFAQSKNSPGALTMWLKIKNKGKYLPAYSISFYIKWMKNVIITHYTWQEYEDLYKESIIIWKKITILLENIKHIAKVLLIHVHIFHIPFQVWQECKHKSR